MATNSEINGGTAISLLKPATTPLGGTEQIPLVQNGKTLRASVNDVQQSALTAANAAQSTADNAASNASTALSTANSAASAASSAQSTANSKLSTVAVDGTTVTGDGTIGNPLVANVPTLYEQITKVDFAALVAGNDLVAGKSYLVEDAYTSSLFGEDFDVLVTAAYSNGISGLSWVVTIGNTYLKCATDVTFSTLVLSEHTPLNPLAASMCLSYNGEFEKGTTIYIESGTGFSLETSISGTNSSFINYLNVKNLSRNGILCTYDPVTDTIYEYSTPSYKSYVAMISQGGTSAPVATVMQNELSGAIVFTRTGGGVYIGTLAGAFTQNKTYATISQTSYHATAIIGFYFPNEDIFQISVLTSAPAGIDSEINQAMLEIRVYN